MVFLVVSVILLNVIAYLMPKRLAPHEMWTTGLFTLVLDYLVDTYLDRKYDLYGYFTHQIDWLSLIPIFGLYPAVSLMFLNFYPYTQNVWCKSLYIAGWSVFSLLFEYASVQSGYFYHNGWKLWYSALCYPVLLGILVGHLIFIRKLETRRKASQ
ncbi:hypothetical protein JZ786_06625 [Alicyclobacillus mengziensis]|uniref:Uncharacterized protein n=1 Tax=Alicyclobacillus mengziensis TaxID=2931921 RepID=A0A9X7W105_9BACL|nr:hypothetical protein JZ786_06625 [Alicyclobacillus mengziensis]